MHTDPAATDAFNALISGHKWWVILPPDVYEFNTDLSCDKTCSDFSSYRHCAGVRCDDEEEDLDITNMLWFKHILPQIRYGRIF